MAKLTFSLLAFLVLVPSVSFAAPLTQTQATSLIAVVQASPNTPASAFTNLITAFSNITVAQAESLIGVVQAAPGVAANAFVSLLVSFTQDTAQSSYVNPNAPITPTGPAGVPVITTQATTISAAPQITNVAITPSTNTATAEWYTNIPTDSKLFISGNGVTTGVYKSQSGIATHHLVNLSGLSGGATYSYQIEADANGQSSQKSGTFSTVNKQGIVVTRLADEQPEGLITHGGFNFKIVVLDSNGNPTKGAMVHIDGPDNLYPRPTDGNGNVMPITDQIRNTDPNTNKSTASNYDPTSKDATWYCTFEYVPQTTGTKTVTFTSGSLTTSVVVQVQ